ncbi:SRPBCC family protein [Niallia sp. Krafla_26]|uniref:SRPBCC family protein n=1 Tax=Niallia sp. Krafla_26 TaxID=3064703 RepID=UPI003D165EDC
MNLSGTAKFKESYDVIWEALHSEEILKNAIPGCQSLTLNEDGEYDVYLKLGVAAVKGEYTGKAKFEDVEKPTHYRLHASGSGKPGFVDLQMDCKIEPIEEGCQVIWECEAEIGGMIAGVGSRVIGGVAKFLAGNFFKDVQKQLKAGVL